MGEVLGRRHSIIRRLRELRRDRELRDREGVMVAEGLRLAEEALAAGASAELAVVSPRLDALPGGRQLRERVVQAGIPVQETADEVLNGVQDARSAQPILLVVRRTDASSAAVGEERGGPPLVVVAHGIQDPGNLGAMVRTADAAGATAFFTCGGGADPYHPRTVRATMGSVFRLPPRGIPADDALRELRSLGVVILGTDASTGTPYDRFDLKQPIAFCLGGEGGGLPREFLSRTDAIVRIPLHEQVDSLSVSAAAAVLLFEAARQRR